MVRNYDVKIMGANGGVTDEHLRTLGKDSIGHVVCGSGVQEVGLDL